jgi:pyridoxine kinase
MLKRWLKRLSDMGPEVVIITSVPDESKSKIGVLAYERTNNRFWKITNNYISALYPGTGDAFASVIVGSFLNGDSVPMSIDRATQFVSACLKASYGYKYPQREGILLEKVLDTLNMPTILQSYEIF